MRAELIAYLRQARKRRQPRARGEDRRGSIPNRISIHDRPAEIDERIVPGHWESDLIKGAHNASSVATLVERTSLFVTLGKMENATADAAVTSFGMMLNRIDAQCRLSLTYDQGWEMARHEQLCETTGIKVYFAVVRIALLQARAQREHQRAAAPVHAQGYGAGRVLQAKLDDIPW
ncbi:MAG: IS30 family transposase [Burkholderia sp.]